MSDGPVKTCIQCGETYAKNPSMARKQFDRQQFCSKPCSFAYKKAHRRECSVPDCGRPHKVHGFCGMHAQRLQRGSLDDPAPPLPPEERFWRYVSVGSPAECWEWQGTRNARGYGRFEIWKQGVPAYWFAHRYVMLLSGSEPTGNDVVLHECDNPPCVNPNHLRIGTQRDNMQDAWAKGRLHTSGLVLGRLLRWPASKAAGAS